jgi:hypothetical protein
MCCIPGSVLRGEFAIEANQIYLSHDPSKQKDRRLVLRSFFNRGCLYEIGGIADELLDASQMIKTMITRAMSLMLALDYFINVKVWNWHRSLRVKTNIKIGLFDQLCS